MATYTGTMVLSNGQTLTLYYASSQAVDTLVPCDIAGNAASGSDTKFMVRSPCCLQDFVTDQTAGLMEVMSPRGPSGKIIRTTAAYASSVATRMVPRICFLPGIQYSWRMRVAGAA